MRGAVVLAKLLATTQVKNAWSSTTWVMRVANSVQRNKLAGQFCPRRACSSEVQQPRRTRGQPAATTKVAGTW
jgi:hypothetical protein